jgi:hypothetical protein
MQQLLLAAAAVLRRCLGHLQQQVVLLRRV